MKFRMPFVLVIIGLPAACFSPSDEDGVGDIRAELTAPTPIGCFADKSARDLPTKLWSSRKNTPAACIAGCQKAGYAYAGVEYGRECWCGNSYGRYGTSTSCNVPCTGDSSQICGGSWANDVYSTQAASPVNGACGAANGVVTNTAPTTGLCSTGTASAVTGSGPWIWTCAGSNGGSTASCLAPISAPLPPPPPSSGIEEPGPSAALFANPPYTCTRNFYVATTGADTNDGSLAHPWKTMQHANDAGHVGGDCINVQPGTYAGSYWTVTHGGNVASPTGYVAYRCTTLNGCIMSDWSGAKIAIGVNYVVFDGFDFAASTAATYGIGLNAWDEGGTNTSNHHIWAINNKIHGYGQSGIQFNDGDWYLSIHNAAYDNSHVTCDAQGSGISYVVEKALAGYTPTAADQAYAPFHHVVAWNDVHDNALTKCGTPSNPYDTDGNGIIMDTFSNAGGTNIDYPYPSLVSFNVTYNNGGGGVHIFLSNHVTVANNTAYDNQLDPANRGTYRPQIGVNNSGLPIVGTGPSNLFINNIAYSVVGSGFLSCNAAFSAGGNGHDAAFQNNVSYAVGTGCNGDNPTWDGNVFSCSANKCATNPQWVSVGKNFALQATSPAIGYGQAQSYLSPQSVDVGACDHRLTSCP